MADKGPSALTAADTLDGSEVVHVVQGGNSRKATTADIAGLTSGIAISDVTGLQTALDNKIDDSQADAGGLAVLGAADAAAVRAAAGVIIGTDVQAYDATLDTYAGIDPSTDVQTMLGAADNAAIRTAIGAGTGSGGVYDANWFNVVDYGAAVDGVTDDTTALQDAIDACATAGGGTVFIPRGTGPLIVNGALQDTSRSNAQILLPLRDYGDTEAITVVLRGEAPPPAVISVVGATPLPDNLSIIKGTLNTASGTAPCMIGGHGPVGTSANFTNVYLVIRDLTVQMPANPALTAVDASCVAQLDADNLLIHAGSFDVGSLSAQTTSTSYALRTPGNGNGAVTRLGIVNVVGFYNGYEIAEHCNGQNVVAMGCKQGLVFIAAAHSSTFSRILVQWCQMGIVFTGAHATTIQEYNIEHAASGTWVTTYDIDDASNLGVGAAYWHTVLAGTGSVTTLLVNGAAKLKRQRIGHLATAYVLVDGATVTVDCSIADNFTWTIGGNRTFANPTAPYDGQVINVRIKQDATGSRTWTLGSKFKFSALTNSALSTAANSYDLLSAQYSLAQDTWFCSMEKGFT